MLSPGSVGLLPLAGRSHAPSGFLSVFLGCGQLTSDTLAAPGRGMKAARVPDGILIFASRWSVFERQSKASVSHNAFGLDVTAAWLSRWSDPPVQAVEAETSTADSGQGDRAVSELLRQNTGCRVAVKPCACEAAEERTWPSSRRPTLRVSLVQQEAPWAHSGRAGRGFLPGSPGSRKTPVCK